MEFVNIKELAQLPSKYIQLANGNDDIVITQDGHPYALLVKIDDEELDDYILAKHFDLENEFEIAKQEYASKKHFENVIPTTNEIPNELTAETIRKSEAGQELHHVRSVDELFNELES
jgi:antitoxin (DNA-binding transcriptional repressor) of toxin-antitoxin stability system